MKHEPTPSRRSLLQTALAAPMSAAMKPPAASDLIEKENRKEGSDWQLTNVKLAGRNQFRTQLIEGYCSHQSIEAGQTLQIMVSTNPPGQFEIEIFRMGYYGGRGARRVTVLGPFKGKTQPDPDIQPRRLRECRWEPSAEVRIPAVLCPTYLVRLVFAVNLHWQQHPEVGLVRVGRPVRACSVADRRCGTDVAVKGAMLAHVDGGSRGGPSRR